MTLHRPQAWPCRMKKVAVEGNGLFLLWFVLWWGTSFTASVSTSGFEHLNEDPFVPSTRLGCVCCCGEFVQDLVAMNKSWSTSINSVPCDQEEVQVDWDKAIIGSYLKILQLSMGQRPIHDPERFPVLYFPLIMWACTSCVIFLKKSLCCSSHINIQPGLQERCEPTATSKSSETCVYQGVNESYLGSPWQLDAEKRWWFIPAALGAAYGVVLFLRKGGRGLLLVSSGLLTLQTNDISILRLWTYGFGPWSLPISNWWDFLERFGGWTQNGFQMMNKNTPFYPKRLVVSGMKSCLCMVRIYRYYELAHEMGILFHQARFHDFMWSRIAEMHQSGGSFFFSRGGEVVKDERTPRALPSANAWGQVEELVERIFGISRCFSEIYIPKN